MTNHPIKYDRGQNKADTWKHNWEVMKPFVYFAFKAMTLIGGAVVGIIKMLPMLAEHKDNPPAKNTRVIKI